MQREPSGRERNGSQPDEGARDLALPTLGKMQGEAAGLAGDASGEGEETSPEDLGGYDLLAQAEPHRPAVQVVGHDPVSSTGQALYCQPGSLRQAQDWPGIAQRGDG